MKRFAAPVVLLLSMACASTPMQSSSEGGSARVNLATRPADAQAYILLDSPGQVRSAENIAPIYPLHIRGTMTNKGFIPAGNIQGHGKLCDGKDWLSLADLTVHKSSESQSPVAPYVLGCVATNGFQPASRDIVMN